MSNTYKTTAAWYAHHAVPDENSNRERTAKRKVSVDAIPTRLNGLTQTIDQNWVAIRCGNQRKAQATAKKQLRKLDRTRSNRVLQSELRSVTY